MMANNRLWCAVVLVALSLIAESTAKPSGGSGEGDELKELLGAMKRYLLVKSSSSRTDAHDDVRTVYDSSTSASAVSTAEDTGNGYWTDWINADDNPDFGTGEFEDTFRIKLEQNDDRKCYLGCQKPVACSYSLADEQATATWTDIESCVGAMDSERVTSDGFVCVNADARTADKTQCQMNSCEAMGLGPNCTRCPDVRVRFFCMGQQPDEDTCCPYAQDACNKRSSLRTVLAGLPSDDAKRDVIANILHEVEDALPVASSSTR